MKGICAGIVLFNPDIKRLQENIEAVLPQVDIVYLVDNGSENIDAVRFYVSKKENIKLIENTINRGIAAALNQLMLCAEEDGFDWILTLDQDSVVYDNIIECYAPYINTEEIAILCPKVVDDNEEILVRSSSLPEYQEVERCITSGSLTNVFVWRKAGGFDEAMFIDCVDFDYCTNVCLKGYKILRVNAAQIHHRLGKASEIRFFMVLGKFFRIEKWRKPVFTYNHSVERTYYYARNILYYIKKYKGKINTKAERKVYLKWFVLKVFFEKQGFKKFFAIIRGSIDSKKLYKLYKVKNKI